MINLEILQDDFTIIQTSRDAEIPPALSDHGFYSITKTEDEISIIVNRKIQLPDARISGGWRGFRVEGILDFSLVGIIYDLTAPLKENGISVFVLSTYNTDYLFVKEAAFDKTIEIFEKTGYINLKKK
jgi:hypothetical protein